MHGFSLWIFAFVKGLEARNNFEVLIDVSRRVIKKLTISLCLSYFRPFTYPIFRQFLYPVPTPHVFFMVITLPILHQLLLELPLFIHFVIILDHS